MALGSVQSLTEMSTTNICWWVGGGGKGNRCVGLTTLPLSCADCLEIRGPQPPGTLRDCPGLQWNCFFFITSLPLRPNTWNKSTPTGRSFMKIGMNIFREYDEKIASFINILQE